MIVGVSSCGDGGSGYCILGNDCTVDKEFIPDNNHGHCDGLKNAFTPSATFTCCQLLDNGTTTTATAKPPANLDDNGKLLFYNTFFERV